MLGVGYIIIIIEFITKLYAYQINLRNLTKFTLTNKKLHLPNPLTNTFMSFEMIKSFNEQFFPEEFKHNFLIQSRDLQLFNLTHVNSLL